MCHVGNVCHKCLLRGLTLSRGRARPAACDWLSTGAYTFSVLTGRTVVFKKGQLLVGTTHGTPTTD
jgi:hypothetical protein